MEAEPSASERAYRRIKSRLLRGGFPLRARLDASAIAAQIGTSTTPVREALIRLSAEGLVRSRQAHGFALDVWSEEELADLYRWRGELAALAVARRRADDRQTSVGVNGEYAERVARGLMALVPASALELASASRRADERLTFGRRSEAKLWADVDAEWQELANVLREGAESTQLATLKSYHQRRAFNATLIRDHLLAESPSPKA